jgi:hypothetical protein
MPTFSVFFSGAELLASAGALDELTAALDDSGADDEAADDAAALLLAGTLADELLLLEVSFLSSPQAAKSMVLDTTTAARRILFETRTVPPLPWSGATVSRYGRSHVMAAQSALTTLGTRC